HKKVKEASDEEGDELGVDKADLDTEASSAQGLNGNNHQQAAENHDGAKASANRASQDKQANSNSGSLDFSQPVVESNWKSN
ncbi:hypothetical protein AB4424_26035, partial [Vibrio splendidus]